METSGVRARGPGLHDMTGLEDLGILMGFFGAGTYAGVQADE
jgi:hypothetical protein